MSSHLPPLQTFVFGKSFGLLLVHDSQLSGEVGQDFSVPEGESIMYMQPPGNTIPGLQREVCVWGERRETRKVDQRAGCGQGSGVGLGNKTLGSLPVVSHLAEDLILLSSSLLGGIV
jgi:hypothetical protein